MCGEPQIRIYTELPAKLALICSGFSVTSSTATLTSAHLLCNSALQARLAIYVQEHGGSLSDVVGSTMPAVAVDTGVARTIRPTPSSMGVDELSGGDEIDEYGSHVQPSAQSYESPRVDPAAAAATAGGGGGGGRTRLGARASRASGPRGGETVDRRSTSWFHSPRRSHARSPLRKSHNDDDGSDDESSLFGEDRRGGIGSAPPRGLQNWDDAGHSVLPHALRSHSPHSATPSPGGGSRHGVAGRWSSRRSATARSPARQQYSGRKR